GVRFAETSPRGALIERVSKDAVPSCGCPCFETPATPAPQHEVVDYVTAVAAAGRMRSAAPAGVVVPGRAETRIAGRSLFRPQHAEGRGNRDRMGQVPGRRGDAALPRRAERVRCGRSIS